VNPEERLNATAGTACSELTLALLMRFFVFLWYRCKRKVDQLIENDTLKWPTKELNIALSKHYTESEFVAEESYQRVKRV